MNFQNYKFKCSQLGGIVNTFYNQYFKNPLTELQQERYKELVNLGKTKLKEFQKLEEKLLENEKLKKDFEVLEPSKRVLKEIFFKEYFQIDEFQGNNFTERGTKYENNSIELLNQVYKTDYKKNEIRKENDFLTGECDVIAENSIIDIKTMATFKLFDEKTEQDAMTYYWQLWGYRQLFGKEKSFIVYALPSWDDLDIQLKQGGYDNEKDKQTFLNMNFERINPAKRIKIFEIGINEEQEKTEIIYKYLEKCKDYLIELEKEYKDYLI